MHRSRLCALLIDCNTDDIEAAAGFWAAALGRGIDRDHPGTRGNYVMLETPEDEPIVQLQRVTHESRVHIDVETDDIPAEVARLEITRRAHRATPRTLGRDGSAHGPAFLHRPRAAPGIPEERDHLGLTPRYQAWRNCLALVALTWCVSQ